MTERGKELSNLWQAIVENTQGDMFWIGAILLDVLEQETGYKGDRERIVLKPKSSQR